MAADTTTAIVVAVIAAIPGIWGAVVAYRSYRESKNAQQTEFGTRIAAEAFASVKAQVAALQDADAEHQRERDRWEAERTQLAADVARLTAKLHQTNNYLLRLLLVLEQHNIPKPPPPPLDLLGDAPL